MPTRPINFLAKLSTGTREAILWEPLRLRSAGFPDSSPASIQSLRIFPALTPPPANTEPIKLGIALILKLGQVEEEIFRAIATAGSNQPIDLLSAIAGEGKPFALAADATLKIKPLALSSGAQGIRGQDKIVGYGFALIESPFAFFSQDSSSRSESISDSKEISTENKKRVSLLIVNEGPASCWINLRNSAVARTGILLTPGGSSYEIAGSNPWFGPLSAICLPGTSTYLSISEVSFR
jgi:hypothetical protein